jgi:hypothetical protein
MEIIYNIIPVILITIIIMYPENLAAFAQTILGKLFIVAFIVFCSSIRVSYGIIACILVVLYYRSTSVEGFNDAKQSFREQNCKNGGLMHKNIPVKPEMAGHVFPELNFESKPCNPCSTTCDFSIIEEKLSKEEDLVAPKNSNDWFHETWSKLWGVSTNPVPAFRLKSEPFSTIAH